MMFSSKGIKDEGPLTTFLNILTFLVLGFLLIDVAAFAISCFRFPFQIDYGEGCTLSFLKDLMDRGNYFFDLNQYPLSYATYPPLFMSVCALVSPFFQSLIMTTRFVSITSTVLLMIVLYFLILRVNGKRTFAFLLTLMLPVFWCTKIFFPMGRLDFFTAFLTVSGLLTFQIFSEKKSPKRYFAFLFFILAFFSKQNAVFAPAAILLDMLLSREKRKDFLYFLGIYLVPLLFLFVGLNFYTRGEALQHLFVFTLDRHWWPQLFFRGWTPYFWDDFGALFLLTFLGLFVKKNWLGPQRIYIFFYIFNFLNIYSLGYTGSNVNYLLEPAISMLILAGFYFRRWLPETLSSRDYRLRALVLSALIFLQVAWLFISYYKKKDAPQFWGYGDHFQMTLPENEKLDQLVKESEGDLLSEDLLLLVRNNKRVFLGCSLPKGEEGIWEPEVLIQDCKKQRFSMVIAGRIFASHKELMGCLEKYYDAPPRKQGEGCFVFRPKKVVSSNERP